MKELLTHYWHNNRLTILEHSVINCHARGVHSIVLKQRPLMIRLFYTANDHELWKNDPQEMINGLSIGFHAHHCALTLVPVLGSFINWTARLAAPAEKGNSMPLLRYRWDPALTGGAGTFKFLSHERLVSTGREMFSCDRPVSLRMPAEQLHTVCVPQYLPTAWLVMEGLENPEHQEDCYTNQPLDSFSSKGFYQRMSPETIEFILQKCGAEI